MSNFRTFMDTISEIGKFNVLLKSTDRQLEGLGPSVLNQFRAEIDEAEDWDQIDAVRARIISMVTALHHIRGSLNANLLAGNLISYLIELERSFPGNRIIMGRLVNPALLSVIDEENPNILVVNPGSTSTKVAWFRGLELMEENEVHINPDETDGVESRTGRILEWMASVGLDPGDLRGIACRGGFMKPVPGGTYRVCQDMIRDLENPRINHASNMAVFIGKKIAAQAPNEGDILLTVTDPVVSDEVEMVERITGLAKIRTDGTGAHYLNHKAVLRVIGSISGVSPADLRLITAHVGGGTSIALHKNNRVTSVIDAFSGVPSANRCGKLDMPRLVNAMKHDQITIKELESAVFKTGGLLSLAGTNDFRALESFTMKGANEVQQSKINVIYDFYARQISGSMLKLCADGTSVDYATISGGLARSEDMTRRIRDNIHGTWPLVVIPGSLEHEALAAGLLNGIYSPTSLSNYPANRDELARIRRSEDVTMDTQIFQRNIFYRKPGTMIRTLDELIDDTLITVKDNRLPTVAIVGANNEEAILAAKKANEEGTYKVARFMLVGDYTAINKIAYDYDLVIDNSNYIIEDTDDAIARGIELLEEGKVDILMKGSYKTEEILRGVFRYLKSSGRLKPGQLISHCVVMDIPKRNKLLIISDAAVNTYPDLEKRVMILENTLKVAKVLNIQKPKVAIISAIESVNKSIESSIEASQIAERFAGREDCIVEGPLSFDVAMDTGCALEKKYKGEIKGTADILIMPDIDAGNVLYKTLTTQSGAVCAGIILAGDMPLILTSRGDSARSKLASICLSVNSLFRLPK